ncbi:MAG: phage tail sheath C-terminal domain-containing protein [Bacteroidia bacterium]
MAQSLMTPGVYIEEVNAFPGSVVEVATAIPAFIGYTEKATRNGKTLVNQPVRITSYADYLLLFGGAFKPTFTLDAVADGETDKNEITINAQAKVINYMPDNVSYMFRGLQLFFNNGGGTCYIVSVGTYEGKVKVEIKKDDLVAGLATLLKEQEPTMIVIPDAVKLAVDECYDVYKQVLAHCNHMQSRVAILDIYDGDQARIRGNAPEDIIANFRELIGTEYLKYAAAYYPWLNTNIVQKVEITFENLDSSVHLEQILPETAALSLVNAFPKDDGGFLMNLKKDKPDDFAKAFQTDVDSAKLLKPAVTFPTELDEVKNPPVVLQPLPAVTEPKPAVTAPAALAADASDKDKAKFDLDSAKFKDYQDKLKLFHDYQTASQAYATYQTAAQAYTDYQDKLKKYFSDLNVLLVAKSLTAVLGLLPDYKKNKNLNYHQGLIATSPTYSNLLDEIRGVMNLLPPSSAMAGIYTMVDNNRGVWKSPANISLNSVIKPSTNITHDEQENLNIDAVSGKSINAIRTFPGIGTLVWGARTLDGNSLDWKYINVRRTMIMLEQSIKLALRSYVFEPNDANTWVTVRSMIVNFLTEKWKQGALAGASPGDAFDVQIGLGITMTGLDILEGKMLVSVKLAIVRPAEFIVVTFEQQMQKS